MLSSAHSHFRLNLGDLITTRRAVIQIAKPTRIHAKIQGLAFKKSSNHCIRSPRLPSSPRGGQSSRLQAG